MKFATWLFIFLIAALVCVMAYYAIQVPEIKEKIFACSWLILGIVIVWVMLLKVNDIK